MYTYQAENLIKNNLSLHIFKRENKKPEPLHTHNFVEIVYIADGEGEEVVDGRHYTVRRGDLIFINYGSTHTFCAKGKLVYYNICFLPEILSARILSRNQAFDILSLTALEELRDEKTDIGLLRFEGEEKIGLEFILKEMLEEYQSDLLERSVVLESYMTVLITKLLRKAHKRTTLKQKEFEGVWQALLEFIEENLDKKLTLPMLAKRCFYNPSYFSRAFKEKFGVSLVEYITKERTRMATEFLIQTTDSIESIAEKCGFSDKKALYRAFEKYYDCTPTEYRRKKYS